MLTQVAPLLLSTEGTVAAASTHLLGLRAPLPPDSAPAPPSLPSQLLLSSPTEQSGDQTTSMLRKVPFFLSFFFFLLLSPSTMSYGASLPAAIIFDLCLPPSPSKFHMCHPIRLKRAWLVSQPSCQRSSPTFSFAVRQVPLSPWHRPPTTSFSLVRVK